jgi:hypothetical protein
LPIIWLKKNTILYESKSYSPKTDKSDKTKIFFLLTEMIIFLQ